MTERTVHPVGSFFNDGPVYLLYSSSLGGGEVTPAGMQAAIDSADASQVRSLLEKGACLPLYFPGDCALDQAVIVVGDLTELEESEWIGRIRARLDIPCGRFVLQAYGQLEDVEEAIAHDRAPNPASVHFVKVGVAPGSYLVEVYAFVSSMTVNEIWEPLGGAESVLRWWEETRPGTAPPVWLERYRRDGFVEAEQGLLEYLVRLSPTADGVPIPEQEEELGLCGVFEPRMPERCPRGIALGPDGAPERG